MDRGNGREVEAVAREFGGQTFKAKARPRPPSRAMARTAPHGPSREVGSKDEIGMWMFALCMTHNFCARVCATTHKRKIIQLENGEKEKLMTRTNIGDMGEPIGVIFLSKDGDAFALTKLCFLQRSFSYNEPTAPAKVGDISGEPHLRMPIAGVGSRLWLAFVPVEPKEFGELCSCKLFLYKQHHTCGNGSALSILYLFFSLFSNQCVVNPIVVSLV
ncbi:hypothetical protein MTR67_042878 [Solanum verrucosum]|uniref:Uncharacterized protein n=1 Tax=Solanum verrucosum TaxID=315347 RepID=A0AAF0UMS9_SOLVR|nr:hypothetical protein MTR67_042878 [Solanum verrucosum]